MHKQELHNERSFVPCGIEVSLATLVVDLQGTAQREFPNGSAGHQALVRFLKRSSTPVRACMEATGNYGLDLAVCLQEAGLALMIANPRAVRHFAQALMQRSKNDQLDAVVLREYAARMPFQPWQRPSPKAMQLMAIAHRLQNLTSTLTAERNRQHAAGLSRLTPAAVSLSLARTIRELQREIGVLRRAAQELILGDVHLERRYQLLLSIPGVGAVSAVHLLAELLRLGPHVTVRQWVAYAGLDPRQHRSGSSVDKKPRLSKNGNASLRRALYMPALVAVRHQENFRGFYQHLVEHGKSKMQALVAAMRKLLHAIFGMFRQDQFFDGAKVYALAPEQVPVCA
jgi:transposase